MRGRIGIALLAAALATGTASMALAQSPEDASVPAVEPTTDAEVNYVVLGLQRRPEASLSPGLDDEIIVACLRLPTLADLSKERWNETHRRFEGRRGRPIRSA